MIGLATREEILAANPSWVEELVRAEPDGAVAQHLVDPAAEAEVVVFFGSWCSDSRRELTRLWRAVELTGGDFGFPIRYVGVDRSKTAPADLIAGVELLFVPTVVVSRNGVELGRIIESAPGGIERDLLALLSGEESGLLSGRDDLGGNQESGFEGGAEVEPVLDVGAGDGADPEADSESGAVGGREAVEEPQ